MNDGKKRSLFGVPPKEEKAVPPAFQSLGVGKNNATLSLLGGIMSADRTVTAIMEDCAKADTPESCAAFVKLFSNLSPEKQIQYLTTAVIHQTELIQIIAILLDVCHVLTNENFLALAKDEQTRYQAVRKAVLNLIHDRLSIVFESGNSTFIGHLFSQNEEILRPSITGITAHFAREESSPSNPNPLSPPSIEPSSIKPSPLFPPTTPPSPPSGPPPLP